MSSRVNNPIRDQVLQGFKYPNVLSPFLDRLHEVGGARDEAGNRSLHRDQHCLLVLLFLFNPVVRSSRSLQQASGLEGVQRKLGGSRTSLGSLSEAIEVFDPERLQAIIGDLAQQVQSHCGWRLRTHLDIDRHVPTRIDVTTARSGGEDDEEARLRAALPPDHGYVMERWRGEFRLWNEIVAKGSSYVGRIRDSSNLDGVVEERPVSGAAKKAGVARDIAGDLGEASKPGGRPDHAVRVVLVATTAHAKRGGRKGGTAGPSSDGMSRIATNPLDAPAEVIADTFRHGWTIEIVFRFFKHVLGCEHLLSTHPRGIEIQAYCAIIARLLTSVWTGGKPRLRTYEMLCFSFAGWATLEELTNHISK